MKGKGNCPQITQSTQNKTVASAPRADIGAQGQRYIVLRALRALRAKFLWSCNFPRYYHIHSSRPDMNQTHKQSRRSFLKKTTAVSAAVGALKFFKIPVYGQGQA